MLKVTLADGVVVETTQELRNMSKNIDTAMMDNESEEVQIDFPHINKAEFDLLLQYCAHHEYKKKESDV